MKNRILLIAIGVSMVDIRTALALQKLEEEDFIIVNNEQDAIKYIPNQGGNVRTPHQVFDEKMLSLPDMVAEPFISYNNKREALRHKDTYKPRFNANQRGQVRFRHPQAVRRG